MFTYKVIDGKFIPYFIPDQYKTETDMYIPVTYTDIVDSIDWYKAALNIQNELIQNNIFTASELNNSNGQRLLMKTIQKNIYNRIKELYNND